MLRLAASVIVCAFITSATSYADDGIAVAGVGVGITCGQYMHVYKSDPAEVDRTIVAWMDGFLSGMNVFSLSRGERSKDLGTRDSRARLLHDFCDKHPLQDVRQAAMAIYQELRFDPAAKTSN